MADKVWRRGLKRTQGGHKADTRRTHGGHMADTRRTSSREAARAYRGQPFFSKREPHNKLFGEKESMKHPNALLVLVSLYEKLPRKIKNLYDSTSETVFFCRLVEGKFFIQLRGEAQSITIPTNVEENTIPREINKNQNWYLVVVLTCSCLAIW